MKVITLKKNKNAMPLKRKVGVLRKMMILKIVKRMRVLMMEMSQRSFMKHGFVFLCPLMRLKFWESRLQGYVKQKGAKDYS